MTWTNAAVKKLLKARSTVFMSSKGAERDKHVRSTASLVENLTEDNVNLFERIHNWFINNARQYCDPDVLENLNKKQTKKKSKKQEMIPGSNWTARRVARIRHASLFEEGKKWAQDDGIDNLKIFRPAENYMWTRLTEEQRLECAEVASDLNNGRNVDEGLQRRLATKDEGKSVQTFVRSQYARYGMRMAVFYTYVDEDGEAHIAFMETEEQPTFSSSYPKVHGGRLNMSADFNAYGRTFGDTVSEDSDEDQTKKKQKKSSSQPDTPSWAALQFMTDTEGEKWPMLPKRPDDEATGVLKGCKFLLRAYISWLWEAATGSKKPAWKALSDPEQSARFINPLFLPPNHYLSDPEHMKKQEVLLFYDFYYDFQSKKKKRPVEFYAAAAKHAHQSRVDRLSNLRPGGNSRHRDSQKSEESDADVDPSADEDDDPAADEDEDMGGLGMEESDPLGDEEESDEEEPIVAPPQRRGYKTSSGIPVYQQKTASTSAVANKKTASTTVKEPVGKNVKTASITVKAPVVKKLRTASTTVKATVSKSRKKAETAELNDKVYYEEAKRDALEELSTNAVYQKLIRVLLDVDRKDKPVSIYPCSLSIPSVNWTTTNKHLPASFFEHRGSNDSAGGINVFQFTDRLKKNPHLPKRGMLSASATYDLLLHIGVVLRDARLVAEGEEDAGDFADCPHLNNLPDYNIVDFVDLVEAVEGMIKATEKLQTANIDEEAHEAESKSRQEKMTKKSGTGSDVKKTQPAMAPKPDPVPSKLLSAKKSDPKATAIAPAVDQEQENSLPEPDTTVPSINMDQNSGLEPNTTEPSPNQEKANSQLQPDATVRSQEAIKHRRQAEEEEALSWGDRSPSPKDPEGMRIEDVITAEMLHEASERSRDWKEEEAGFDEASLEEMGEEWRRLADIMKVCILEVRGIDKGDTAWQERRADEALVNLLQPWVTKDLSRPMTRDRAALQLPGDFLSLLQRHWTNKMLFPLEEVSDSTTTHKEVTKKKFWSQGRGGLIAFVVGLRWSWWKVQEEGAQGNLDDWTRLVESVTRILEKVNEKTKRTTTSQAIEKPPSKSSTKPTSRSAKPASKSGSKPASTTAAAGMKKKRKKLDAIVEDGEEAEEESREEPPKKQKKSNGASA